jgi:hypothetical protein
MSIDPSETDDLGPPPNDLSCREVVELVTDYLEGRLAPAEHDRVAAHIDWCPGCLTYIDQMRETIRLTGRLREEDLVPEARELLLEAFRNWKRG